MEIISVFILGMSIVYFIFRLVQEIKKCRKIRYIEKYLDDNKCKSEIDLRYHSFPDFGFKNVQSGELLKISNSGPDVEKIPDNIEVKQYCKY